MRNTVGARLGGAALLAVPVLKLFAYDVFLLDPGYRVAAFIILGVLLLTTGLAYQRFGGVVREFLLGDSTGRPQWWPTRRQG